MATRYVDVDAEVGGDGTTNGLTGGTCAYKSLNIWEAARQADLTSTAAEICICESSHANHTADTTACDINGWTTTAANYIEIKTSTAARHAGVWDDNKYRLSVSGASVFALRTYEDYVRLDGLQITKSSATQNSACFGDAGATATNNELRLSNCILKENPNNSYQQTPLYFGDVDRKAYVWNTIAYGCSTSTGAYNCAVYQEYANSVWMYGCTLIGGVYGWRGNGSGTNVLKNCYIYGVTASINGTSGLTMTTCACSDANGTAADLDNIAHDTDTFVNVTYATADYRLAADGLSPLVGKGTTLTDDPPGGTALGVDIAGTTRS